MKLNFQLEAQIDDQKIFEQGRCWKYYA